MRGWHFRTISLGLAAACFLGLTAGAALADGHRDEGRGDRNRHDFGHNKHYDICDDWGHKADRGRGILASRDGGSESERDRRQRGARVGRLNYIFFIADRRDRQWTHGRHYHWGFCNGYHHRPQSPK